MNFLRVFNTVQSAVVLESTELFLALSNFFKSFLEEFQIFHKIITDYQIFFNWKVYIHFSSYINTVGKTACKPTLLHIILTSFSYLSTSVHRPTHIKETHIEKNKLQSILGYMLSRLIWNQVSNPSGSLLGKSYLVTVPFKCFNLLL